MTQTENLPDEELGQLAAEWRRRALQGDLHARGIAHQLETELRRRSGAPHPHYDTLDMRTLAIKRDRPRWWRFWQRGERR